MEENTREDDLGHYSVRHYRAYMSDGKVLVKSQIKDLSDPNLKWSDGHWSQGGVYEVDKLDAIKGKRLVRGWVVA